MYNILPTLGSRGGGIRRGTRSGSGRRRRHQNRRPPTGSMRGGNGVGGRKQRWGRTYPRKVGEAFCVAFSPIS